MDFQSYLKEAKHHPMLTKNYTMGPVLKKEDLNKKVQELSHDDQTKKAFVDDAANSDRLHDFHVMDRDTLHKAVSFHSTKGRLPLLHQGQML